MILLGVIHWCISIRLASCSSHPSMFVQSVYHSGKSWRHWLTIINLVFISNVLKTIIIIGIELCLTWNTCCVWSVTATCISILYDSIWHSFRASTQDCIIQSHYLYIPSVWLDPKKFLCFFSLISIHWLPRLSFHFKWSTLLIKEIIIRLNYQLIG